jgi:acetate kinase
LDLAIEIDDAASQRAQRGLGGLDGLVQTSGVGAKARAQRRLAADRLALL